MKLNRVIQILLTQVKSSFAIPYDISRHLQMILYEIDTSKKGWIQKYQLTLRNKNIRHFKFTDGRIFLFLLWGPLRSFFFPFRRTFTDFHSGMALGKYGDTGGYTARPDWDYKSQYKPQYN